MLQFPGYFSSRSLLNNKTNHVLVKAVQHFVGAIERRFYYHSLLNRACGTFSKIEVLGGKFYYG
jgi:tRNA U34 5-carboxymethylaminomethyl modifying GTPase MnmE/TrmE